MPGIDPRLQGLDQKTERRQGWQDDELAADDVTLANHETRITETEDATAAFWSHFEHEFCQNTNVYMIWPAVRKNLTITAVYTRRYILGGGAGSIDFQLSHDPTFRAGLPTNVYLAVQTSNAATEVSHPPTGIADVNAGRCLWATMSNAVGVVEDWGLTIQWEWR